MASGCGCKEIYRYPHITYPYSSCVCSFLQQHPYFLFILKMFFVLIPDTLPALWWAILYCLYNICSNIGPPACSVLC